MFAHLTPTRASMATASSKSKIKGFSLAPSAYETHHEKHNAREPENGMGWDAGGGDAKTMRAFHCHRTIAGQIYRNSLVEEEKHQLIENEYR